MGDHPAESFMKSIDFACFSALGTWASQREPCSSCGWHWEIKVPPLLVQWERSNEIIGDFSWDGPFGYTCIVKREVADMIRASQQTCRFMPIDFLKPDHKRNTVPFPCKGPLLSWLQCSAMIELDKEASGVKLESSCPACGDVRYTFRSSEIVIRSSQWGGEEMFRIASNGMSDATFVTEGGRRMIEERGFSNIEFTEAGEIVR